jgi:hypothetical protein
MQHCRPPQQSFAANAAADPPKKITATERARKVDVMMNSLKGKENTREIGSARLLLWACLCHSQVSPIFVAQTAGNESTSSQKQGSEVRAKTVVD